MRECCEVPAADAQTATERYRRILWAVLAINGLMFVVEGGAGLFARSVALQGDALDFLGDAGNYGIALYVLSRPVRWRASAAFLKGALMVLFGLGVLASAGYRVLVLGVPMAGIMGSVGLLALAANVVSAALLFSHRNGDSNRRSVWLCSRNDAIANLAVILAAGAVHLTATGWPDLVVGALIAGLALSGGVQVMRQAAGELRHDADRRVPATQS